MFKRLGYDFEISHDQNKINDAKRLILPGVGAFDYGVKKLKELDLYTMLQEKACQVPFMGICLGAQLLMNESQEGVQNGLGLFDFNVRRFSQNLKVPHMGWNGVKIENCATTLEVPLDKNARFYFLHSYYIEYKPKKEVWLTSHYGLDFVSAIQSDKLIAVQFHPEKSHRFGMKLFEYFMKIPTC